MVQRHLETTSHFSFVAFLHIRHGRLFKPFCFHEKSYTLELDLTRNIDTIYSNFAKQVRQQNTLAIKEGITYCFHEDAKGFANFFNEFAEKKGIYQTSERRLKEMQPHLKLVYALKDGQVLAAHSFIFDAEQKIVRHFHSATRRLDNQFDARFIGRANKFLIVRCIEYFKSNGFSTLDFGGVRHPLPYNSNNGVNNYKMLFGGSLVTCYNSYSPFYYLLKNAGKKVKFLGDRTTV